MLDFKDVELNDKARFDAIINACDPDGELYCGADYIFGNLFIWRHRYATQLAFDGNACFISENGGEYAYFPICGDAELPCAIEKLAGKRLLFATDAMLAKLDALGVNYECEPIPDSFDYVYRYDDLADLPGKKYHQKRNHIAYFETAHPDYVFQAVTPENIEECKEFSFKWAEQSLHGIDGEERLALDNALGSFFELGFEGGLIRAGGEVVAMSAGERRGSAFVVHIEKALGIRGAYPLINREFVRNVCAGCCLINREEDMGLEGLAKAKKSYHPAFVMKKYSVRICG